MRRRAAAAAVVLLAAGGAAAAIVVGHHGIKQVPRPKASAPKRTVRPAHGLMLFPLADPDAHIRDAALP